MHGQDRRRNSKSLAVLLDIMHVVFGIIIVILALISFFDPEGNMLLLPIIFLLAAILNGANGFYRMKECGRDNRMKLFGFGTICVGMMLFVLSIISAVSIWR